MMILLKLYFLGCVASLFCVIISSLYLWILQRSPLSANLEKLNLHLNWATGKTEALHAKPPREQLIREYLWEQTLNICFSWVGVIWYVIRICTSCWNLMTASPSEKNSRHLLLNKDLSVQEALESLLDLYNVNDAFRDELRKKLHDDLLLTPQEFALNWRWLGDLKDGIPLDTLEFQPEQRQSDA